VRTTPRTVLGAADREAPEGAAEPRIMQIKPWPSHTAGFRLLLCSEPRHHADGKSMGRIDWKDAVARKQ